MRGFYPLSFLSKSVVRRTRQNWPPPFNPIVYPALLFVFPRLPSDKHLKIKQCGWGGQHDAVETVEDAAMTRQDGT